jgi:hypothetical protein
MPELACQIGSNTALDACISAMVALYRTRQYKESKVDALVKYGAALRAVMTSVRDPAQNYYIRMQTVLIMFVCQVRNPGFLGISLGHS